MRASSHHRRILLATLLVLLATVSSTQAFWTKNKEEPPERANTASNSNGVSPDHEKVEYGVDVSFPMQHSGVSTNYPWLEHNLDASVETPEEYKDMKIQPLGDRQKFYDHFMEGCRSKWGTKGSLRCEQNEADRIAMSLRQPQSMQNYTDVGFKKIRAPEKVFKLIKEFWDKNKDNQKLENWGQGNTYTNNWDSPSYMVSVEDRTLRGGGSSLKQAIWDAAKETIQEWTGEELTQCSLYGVRVYTEGAVLATHVDRLPLVSSAIINVAQDVDEPWPLEVYGHDGKATNVTMEPGDMVLYESHSVLHGRPFPLKGRYLANIFIHFEPTGHSLRHNAKMEELDKDNVHDRYKKATERRVSGHEAEDHDGLPSYIIPGTPEEANWRRRHPNNQRSRQNSFTTGSTSAHKAAQDGDVERLAQFIEKDKSLVSARDENGWQPLHESARAGHVDCAKLLHGHGADINARAGEDGGTPLWWALRVHDEDHPIVDFLQSVGGLNLGPDL